MPTTKKNVPMYTSSVRDENGVLYEQIAGDTDKPSKFVAYLDENQTTVDMLRVGGKQFSPYPPTHPYLRNKVVLLPSTVTPISSRSALISAVDIFLRRYVSLSNVQYLIATHYILMSWIYDHFSAIPYLRVRGDYGTGKSRFLQVVGGLCYTPLFASGASTVAPIFHLIDRFGGTLVLDEADFRYSSETAEIVKILNNGNAKNFPVLRCQKTRTGTFETVAYRVFGPKVIATRQGFEDQALESRCITFEMHGLESESTIPTSLPGTFCEEMDVLRGALLSFRLQCKNQHGDNSSVKDAALSARSKQMYSPILSVVETDETREVILAFAREHQAQMIRDRGMGVVADVLRTLYTYYQDTKKPPAIGAVAAIYAKMYCRDSSVSAKWIGSVIRRDLRLTTQKSNGRYVVAPGQHDKLTALYRNYDIP